MRRKKIEVLKMRKCLQLENSSKFVSVVLDDYKSFVHFELSFFASKASERERAGTFLFSENAKSFCPLSLEIFDG